MRPTTAVLVGLLVFATTGSYPVARAFVVPSSQPTVSTNHNHRREEDTNHHRWSLKALSSSSSSSFDWSELTTKLATSSAATTTTTTTTPTTPTTTDWWSTLTPKLEAWTSSLSMDQLTDGISMPPFPTTLPLLLPDSDALRTDPDWISNLVAVALQMNHIFTGLPVWGQVGVGVSPIVLWLIITFYQLSSPPDDYRTGVEPYLRGNYDPIQAQAYYAKHRKVVLQRTFQLIRLSNRFLMGLLLDKYIFRNEEQMRGQRAQELLALITKLGPTAIKVGQALSVRPDLIPEEYSTALATLQDQVPPFSNAQAKRVLLQELGPVRYEALQGIATASPVASASIGQVYKSSIGENNNNENGRDVAIKVQRPNVLADIALDLYIVREFAPFYQKYIARSQTDLQALANEWGRGFIGELDYRQEASKTIQFNVEMERRNLDAVMAPVVLQEYSTEQILVTEWIDGTRIDQSDAADIPRLCSVALNAYLVMLLELQSLHCDPHPGNLLRTKDGRLCILDFGMTLDVDPTLQYSLLEYIAHCTSDNYEKVPDDLVRMGFLKADKLEYAKRSGVLEPLIYFLRQAGKGGGAKAVRERVFAEFRERYPGLDDDELRVKARQEMKNQMQEMANRESVATGITTEVEELQKRNQDSFSIPEWFLYASRAFITLEGVSLQADESYSLIQSCFPYIAKRLVQDDSPRAQKALKELLYGAGDMVDVSRLGELADGFSTYTTTTKTVNALNATAIASSNGETNKDAKTKLVEAEAAITLAKDSADVLLDPKGNVVQDLLVEESALAASARVKDEIKDRFVDAPQRFRDSLPFGVGGFLPPLPFEGAVAPFVQKTETEEKAQKLIDKLGELAQSAGAGQLPQSVDAQALNDVLGDIEPEQAALIVRELRENVPKYTGLMGQLGTKFTASLLEKASENIETTLTELNGKETDQVVLTAVRGISSVAQQGAKTIKQQQTASEMEEADVIVSR